MSEMPLESTGIIEQGQHKHYRAVHAETGDAQNAIVRYVVDLDTSYPRMQSKAYAEAWVPATLDWNRIAWLYNGEWTEPTYACPGGSTKEDDSIMEAIDMLRGQVLPLLAV